MSDLPDAAHIRNLRNTGYRDGKDPTYPVCPICDQTCETIYISADNEIVGCDQCGALMTTRKSSCGCLTACAENIADGKSGRILFS